MSNRKAAKKFGVPESTIRDYKKKILSSNIVTIKNMRPTQLFYEAARGRYGKFFDWTIKFALRVKRH